MLTIDQIPSFVKIGKVATLGVDCEKFNQDVLAYIFAYGLKQVLNDAAALPAGSPDHEKFEAAESKLIDLYNGVVRRQREGRDPVETEIERLVAADFRTKLRAVKGTEPKAAALLEAFKEKAPAWDEALKARVAKVGETFREAAEAAVEARREAAKAPSADVAAVLADLDI